MTAMCQCQYKLCTVLGSPASFESQWNLGVADESLPVELNTVVDHSTGREYLNDKRKNSVGDPDPQDPHVFRPPISESTSHRYGSGSGSGSFAFPINVLSGLKKCLTK
jgi:hypothetical protein